MISKRQINDVVKTENSSTSAAIYHLLNEIIFGRIIFLRALTCELCNIQIKASGDGGGIEIIIRVNEVHGKDGSFLFRFTHHTYMCVKDDALILVADTSGLFSTSLICKLLILDSERTLMDNTISKFYKSFTRWAPQI